MQETAYLDNACTGLVHVDIAAKAHSVIDKFLNNRKDATNFTVALYDEFEEGRRSVAHTLRVPERTVCFIESTSHGLGMIANSIPLEKDDNILICDLEFLSTVLCWRKRMEKTGFHIKTVKTDNGKVPLDTFKAAADSKTKAIVVSSVQEINGYRVDVKALSRFAREIGAYLIVDGIQEAGALDPHIDEIDVDVYCAGGHKWLRNPFGAGFLYINEKLLPFVEPDFYSYFNTKSPPGGWGPYLESPLRTPFDPLVMTTDACKFETGATPNYAGVLALVKAFELIRSKGIKTIENEVLDRRRYLQGKLLKAGASICGSTDEENLSGICTFNIPGGIEKEKELVKLFLEKDIYCSLRYISNVGGIRLGAHYYTSYEELDYLIETVKGFIKSANIR